MVPPGGRFEAEYMYTLEEVGSTPLVYHFRDCLEKKRTQTKVF